MITVCDTNTCCGCMACTSVCKRNAITVEDELKQYNAKINQELCINCAQCQNICPQNHTPEHLTPMEWHQGWAQDSIREKSSSGGFAYAIAKAFIENGGYVASCYYNKNGEFLFKIVDSLSELNEFIGSKYVKSNPENIFASIEEKIKTQKVLFIGLPCQVAAVINFVKDEWRKNLYTIDLICHGTPSPRILNLFFIEQGSKLNQIQSIQFRKKSDLCLYDGERRLARKGMRDRYTICFLKGVSYTENCYQCQYACKERVSDLTLGDSWGTELNIDEQKKGISLLLIQTPKGKELLKNVEITLMDVSLDKAIAANHQLERPIAIPKERNEFFRNIEEGKSFDKAYSACYRKDYLKQEVKKKMIDFGLLGK